MTGSLGPVLVGFDGGAHASDAVRFGAEVASAAGVPLIAAFVWRREIMRDPDSDWDRFLESVASRELEPAARLAPSAELVTTGASSPARGLHELAVARGASLIVVGMTKRGRVGRLLQGSTAQRLLDGAPCAVAVAPPEEGITHRGVLVGFDGTEESDLALSFGTKLADALDVPLRLLSVAEPPPAVPDIPGPLEQARRRIVDRRRHTQGELARAAAAPIGGQVVEAEGDPADVLVARAAPDDVLVIGSREYGPAAAVLLGSVAAEVMARAPCPVVVTPRAGGR